MRDDATQPAPLRYGTIVIVGGGCYGTYYHRQLQRAAHAAAIVAEKLLIVDRDEHCAMAAVLGGPPEPVTIPTELRVEDWRSFFDNYLTTAAADPDHAVGDAIVPSPLMPHLMGEWLVQRARRRSGDAVSTRPFDRVPAVPWERAGQDGTHYVSFATWMCPVNCIEPRICPHTKDVRSWSMPVALDTFARERAAENTPTQSAVLHCTHRAYGVGMFATGDVVAADAQIREASRLGAVDVVIGTVSHCHGALTRLVIAAPPA